jgi:hypothetical protein
MMTAPPSPIGFCETELAISAVALEDRTGCDAHARDEGRARRHALRQDPPQVRAEDAQDSRAPMCVPPESHAGKEI